MEMREERSSSGATVRPWCKPGKAEVAQKIVIECVSGQGNIGGALDAPNPLVRILASRKGG